MRVATFNAHDSAAAVRRSLELAGLLLWQEYPLRRATEPGWLPDSWAVHRGRGNVATGWRLRWWEHRGSEWHQAHDGRRRVTPERGDLVTKLAHRRTQLGVAVVNGHRVNRTRGAWLRVPGIHARWRAERWTEHDQLTRQLVADLVEQGWLVIVGGDWNRRDVDPPHPDAVPIAGRSSIDKLWLVAPHHQRDGMARATGSGEVDRLGSDHALRWADVELHGGRRDG